MAYSKLFSSLVHSSLWGEQDHVRLLFITLLAVADRDGHCWGSRSGFERLAMLDLDACQEKNPWDVLMSPDADSSDRLRNPENEGRRIREIPGGFEIINYVYYRSLRNDDDRKEQNRIAQRRHRDKVSHSKPASAKVSRVKPRSSHADADADADKKKEAKSDTNGAHKARPPVSLEDWIKELQTDKTYQGIDVQREYGKMLNWCKIRNRTPTKRRFVNWLNNLDSPVGHLSRTTINKPQPDGWITWLRSKYPDATQKNFWKVPQSIQEEFKSKKVNA